MDSDKLRISFLEYFRKHNHRIITSNPLTPKDDPTLLFTSAGMVQFKPYFLGIRKPPYKRAASNQRCFRTSDIDKVGTTARHLTFFEMLGNFSFGDYFKKNAIQYAWDFLVNIVGLTPDRLYATVFTDDDEAAEIWTRYIPEGKIVRLGENNNFWSAGPTGPCGPCSEIIYDLGEEVGCGRPDCKPGCDCDRWLEVWNLVFTQFNRIQAGELKPLKQKNIDTGMGLERLACVSQGKKTAFESDLIFPVVEVVHSLSNTDSFDKESIRRAMRIVSDHSRAIAFLIADGVTPSNEGRGYVVRRLIRRSLRSGKVLNIDDTFVWKLCDQVVQQMSGVWLHLKRAHNHILETVRTEEEKFLKTLAAGSKIFDELLAGYEQKSIREISGQDIFRLYDTYGFPIELTQEIAQERGFSCQMQNAHVLIEEQRERGQRSWYGNSKDVADVEKLHRECGTSIFRGYQFDLLTSRITGLVNMSGQDKPGELIHEVGPGNELGALLGETPFYPEKGGQVGDTGEIAGPHGKAIITATITPSEGVIIHKGRVTEGRFVHNEVVEARVDRARRAEIKKHHTATHLLQAALRRVLGTHVAQAGSLVAPERLRFDFTHPRQLSARELELVELMVNEFIQQNMRVWTFETSIKEAQRIGAMALFGEKYGAHVRVVLISRFGVDAPEQATSIELCGGTHCETTGQIGIMSIVSESAIASGVRRIEAVAGMAALRWLRHRRELLDRIAESTQSIQSDVLIKIQAIIDERNHLARDLERSRAHLASNSVNDILSRKCRVESLGINLISERIDGITPDMMRQMIDQIKEKLPQTIIVLASVYSGKVSMVCGVTDDLVNKGWHAGKIIGTVAKYVGGSGGGRQDFAQAGAKSSEKLDSTLGNIADILRAISP